MDCTAVLKEEEKTHAELIQATKHKPVAATYI